MNSEYNFNTARMELMRLIMSFFDNNKEIHATNNNSYLKLYTRPLEIDGKKYAFLRIEEQYYSTKTNYHDEIVRATQIYQIEDCVFELLTKEDGCGCIINFTNVDDFFEKNTRNIIE